MRNPRWPAYAAATWMAVVAGLYVYWAIGGGFPADRPALRMIDPIAVPLCGLGGVAAALALVQSRGSLLPHRRLLGTLWVAAALAIGHCAPVIVDDLLAASGLLDLNLRTHAEWLAHFVLEPSWLVGGVLFVLAALGAMRPAEPTLGRVQAQSPLGHAALDLAPDLGLGPLSSSPEIALGVGEHPLGAIVVVRDRDPNRRHALHPLKR